MRATFAAVAVALALVALVITLGPACNIDSRSDDFRCERPSDCGAGRDCIDGWCVVDPDEVDASMNCPAACTSCMNGTCIIECGAAGACDAKVVCPGTMPCTVRCTGANACDMGVDCATASTCDVTCSGPGSCAGQVTCGAKACTVACDGDGSCGDGIFCDSACACETSCDGLGSCNGMVDCPGNCVQGGDCTTSPPGQCDNC
ncbi:MAG TPA: hypothetical protein VM261_02255 [Kofleriaceae bacterium]|nr:hypothetical protein [Kofleriaceae bacterium]